MSAYDAPLSGASVFVLSDEDQGGHQRGGEGGGGGGGGGFDTEALEATVAALGGRRADVLEEASHALWAPTGFGSSSGDGTATHQPRFWEEVDVMLRDMLTRCRALNLPVVDATWLERMAGLRDGEHWSEVDVSPHVPAVVALVYEGDGEGDGGGARNGNVTAAEAAAAAGSAATGASAAAGPAMPMGFGGVLGDGGGPTGGGRWVADDDAAAAAALSASEHLVSWGDDAAAAAALSESLNEKENLASWGDCDDDAAAAAALSASENLASWDDDVAAAAALSESEGVVGGCVWEGVERGAPAPHPLVAAIPMPAAIPVGTVPAARVVEGWEVEMGVAADTSSNNDERRHHRASPSAPPPPPPRAQDPPTFNRNSSVGSVANRRDSSVNLSTSIGETYEYLAREHPEMLEEDAIRRAMELSLLDCALVLRSNKSLGGPGDFSLSSGKVERPPHELLQIEEGASKDQIRKAYRKRALETHPDKGGEPGEFEAVARAYRSLLNNPDHHDPSHNESDRPEKLKTTAHWDKELQEHRNLVRELFQAHGADVDTILGKQAAALDTLGLKPREAGSMGRNERDEVIRNSCFYLSLAVSYLSGIGALACSDYNPVVEEGGDGGGSVSGGMADGDGKIDANVGGIGEGGSLAEGGGGGDGNPPAPPHERQPSDEGDDAEEADTLLREADEALIHETALQLKRNIEAAVVTAHPEWAVRGLVGEEVQAFSDFLVYVLDSPTLVSEWAVAVFDAASGFVDVYKGKNFPENDKDGDGIDGDGGEWTRSNTLTLRYEPGHYQPILPVGTRERPALSEVLEALTEAEVIYVVTDGKAE